MPTSTWQSGGTQLSRCFDIGRQLSFEQLVTLRDRGDFLGVIPYLDPWNPKGATANYLRDIYRAGLAVPGFFYETTGGMGEGESYFTEARGRADGLAAERLLAPLVAARLAPDPSIVWYAADVNIEPSAFTPYANGIEAVVTAIQVPGIYGFQRLCDYASEPVAGRPHRYPNMGRHLAQTYGQSRPELEVWQHEQITLEGITVDLDEVSVAAWRPEVEEDMTDAQLLAALKRIYPGGLEELVKASVRVMVEQDPETRLAIVQATDARVTATPPVSRPPTTPPASPPVTEPRDRDPL